MELQLKVFVLFSLSNLKPFDFKHVLSDAFSPAVQIKTPLMIFQPKQATCKTNTCHNFHGFLIAGLLPLGE